MEFLKKVVPSDETCNVKTKAPEEMSVKELKATIAAGGLGNQAIGMAEKSELIKLVKDNM